MAGLARQYVDLVEEFEQKRMELIEKICEAGELPRTFTQRNILCDGKDVYKITHIDHQSESVVLQNLMTESEVIDHFYSLRLKENGWRKLVKSEKTSG